MLALTENAATVIRAIVDNADHSEEAGLRIAAATDDHSSGLTVSTADTASFGDIVVEDRGARVFLATDAAVLLEDKILDAEVTDGGNVKFVLATI